MFKYDRQAPSPEETETATFALGCFWGPDATFGALDGVIRTRVGYAGGSKNQPTYKQIGDHTEAVQVDYDPKRVDFARLLDVAFDQHNPRTKANSTQYANILFHHTTDQLATIESELDSRGLDRNEIGTRVEPLDGFTLAEDYHQKYHLRQYRSLRKQFGEYDDKALRESPAAAKVNAAAANELDKTHVEEVVDDVVFDESLFELLRDAIVGNR